ncbi:MAG: phosphoribosylformylglycinamidine synthase subunit PurS [Bdellovibrionota bacterium]
MKVKLLIRIKKEILDPQGKALEASISHLGHKDIQDVRIGKMIEFEIQEQEKEKAKQVIDQLCQQILTNPLLEDYEYEFER